MKHVELITSTKRLLELKPKFLEAKLLAYDCETTGLSRFAEVVGCAFALSELEAYYIPIKIWQDGALINPWKDSASKTLLDFLYAVLTSSKKLITHNGAYDAKVTYNTFKIDILPHILADTQLLHHTVIDESPPHALKLLAVKYLDPNANAPQEDLKASVLANGGSWNAEDKTMYKADWKILGNYACFKPKSAYITLDNGNSILIEDVKEGDSVITHKNHSKKVYRKIEKDYDGDVYKFHINDGRTLLGVTEEHPFLVLNQETLQEEWIKAKDIKRNDLLVKGEYRIEQTSISYNYNNDFWWLFGLYQAEGSLRIQRNSKYPVFTIHKKEVKDLISVLDRLKLRHCVVPKGISLGVDVVITDSNLGETYLKLCNGKHKCWDKQVSKEVLEYLLVNKEHSKYFICGFLDGDSNYRLTKTRSNGHQLCLTTTSPHLLNLLDLICNNLKINNTRRFFDPALNAMGRRRRFISYMFSSSIKELSKYFIFKKIPVIDCVNSSYKKYVAVDFIEKENYKGTVYNISVEDDNSYIVNGIVSHNCHDVIYTIGLYNKFIPHLNSDKLKALWNDEVMPLLAVTYELNTTGIRVDIPYFENLKVAMEQKIDALEDEMYALIEPKVRDYEINKLIEVTKMTKVSQFGKYLTSQGISEYTNTKEQREMLYSWYTSKKNLKRVFNLNSGDDKSFLIYDVLELPVRQMTASGKRSTAKSVLDELAEEFADSSVIVSLIRDRSKELKLLNTYVIPILESHIESRIYPSFNQTGTTSGRYSCGGSSLNLQTLPRDDHRIKAGFIPDEGNVFVAADYASLEPHAFAFESGEPKLKKIFKQGLDFYSSIAIDVMGLKGLSANPKDANYLGTIDKEKRQWIKAIALSIPYGAEAGRISQLMKCDYNEAKDVYDNYMRAYPELAKWMHKSNMQMKLNGYTESLMGRRKRNSTVPMLYNKYGVKDFSKKALQGFIKRFGAPRETILDDTQLYLECRNALNVAKNHKIQSLAASICNAAMIEFQELSKVKGLNVKTVLTIHDEIVVSCSKQISKEVADLLKDTMINNKVTRLIDIPMDAKPVVTDKSLAEAK